MRLLGKDNLPYRGSILPFTACIKMTTFRIYPHPTIIILRRLTSGVLSEGFGLLVPQRFIFPLIITVALALLPFTVASCYSCPADATSAIESQICQRLLKHCGIIVVIKSP